MDVPAEFVRTDEPQTAFSSHLKNKHRQAVPVRSTGVSQGEIGSSKELWEKTRYKMAASLRSRSVSSPQEASLKPTIAHIAGTAKIAKMLPRPKALPKPRSEKPALRSGMSVFKLHTSTEQASTPRQEQPHACWETMPSGSKVCQNVWMDPWKSQVLGRQAPTFRPESMDRKAGKTPTNTWSMKSAAHLLEEAKQIAGIKSMGEEMAPLEEEPDQAPTGDAGRMVDKSKMTDPQSGLSGDTLGDRDTVNVEVLQVVPGDRYIMESEPPGEENTSSKQVALRAVGLQQQQPAPERVALSGVTKMGDTGTDGNLTICKEDDVITTSVCPHKVTYGDFLVVKGGAIATTQRQERLLKQHRSLQGLSFLATWTPKTKTEKCKSIQHLCTAPVFDVLPLGLQLTSRACHTLCQLPVGPQVMQERAAMIQIPDRAQHGIVPPGLPAAQLRHGEGIPRPSALATWQRVTELCTERPRVTPQSQPAPLSQNPLCASEPKMFWNPAPPKFSCTPSVMKDRLFPKYQPSWKDLSMAELSVEGQDLKKLTRDCMDREPAKVRRTFRKSQSMTDVSVESAVEPAACQEQAVKRSLSAPHLSSGLECTVEDLKAISDRQHPAMASVTETLVRARREVVNAPVRGARQGRLGLKREIVSLRKRTIVARFKRHLSKGWEKVGHVHENLGGTRHTLPRSRSLDHVTSGPPDTSAAYCLSVRPCSSLPLFLDLEQYTAQQGELPADPVQREWLQDVWVTWSDDVVPPDGSGDGKEESHSPTSQCTPEALHRLRERELFLLEIQALGKSHLSLTSDTGVTDSDLDGEVDRLTQSIAKQEQDSAFHLCRRGTLYKKQGHLDLAMEDLNQAISLESHLLDAYWHRHSIHLLKRNLTQALADLNFIIKHNSKHADAFRSRAEIYRMKGDTAMAIVNYSQAIKFKPQDDDMYFRRAEMYEKRSETLLAMEDYAKTFAINPRRSDALLIHALQHFHASSWEVALTDFSLLLQLEPRSARARQYRGRIYAKLGMFQEAVADFTLAVRLDPNDWASFYLRGCLLRKAQPEVALRDLSVSALINSSTENVRAFLHRGLLYVGLKRWRQAASDFRSVIKLDRSVVLAHMNLGLIYMLQMDRNYEAIRVFTSGLKVKPTHVQGYVCRAQAYHNVRDFRRAVNDLSCAIHMKPDDQLLYIMRGQYLCDMERFDLAYFCIDYAVQMGKVLPAAWGSSLVQQAAIQAFLGNNLKAMNQLLAAADALPSPHGLLLLGKTQMKAQKFTEAVESFRKTLTLLISDKSGMWSLPEVAEVSYLIGLCYMAQDNLSQALDAFSSAVKINPDLTDAYHQRGLCRMRLRLPESLQDLNRALTIDPSLFQVFLSRATFYEDQGRFAKAILNCTKAIQIQPKSVRAYLHRGTLKFYRRMYSGAVKDFTSAIQNDNTCSFAYYNRGACYQHMKQHKLALRDYGIVLLLASRKEIDLKVLINRALLHVELNDCHNALQDLKAASGKCPEDPTIFHALGVLHHRLGNLQDSVEAYSEAVRLNPLFPEAYTGRGNALMDYCHAEADKRAQRDFVTALHLSPLSSAARVSLGYNLQVLGSFQSAWNQFTVATDLEPVCWAAFEGRALVNLQMKSSYGAFYDINTALKHNPLSDLLHTNRGVIHQFLGDRASAMRDYHKAISLNSDCALAFFNAANLYFYNRQFEQACQFYSRALELDSSDDSALLNRAVTRALLRKIPEALQDFSTALEINPINSHIFFNRANVYCSLKKYHLAEEDLTRALQLLPNDALIYKLRADVRGHLGLTELAISDYRMALQLQEAEENCCCVSPGDTMKF